MSKKDFAILVTAVICLVASTSYGQKQKPTPTPKPQGTDEIVRISTELVQTDVMVFDKAGKFVEGLKPEQFELLVDGQPQPIALFESVVTGGRNERAALRAARENKRAQTLEVPEPTNEVGRTVLFFVNDLHLEPGSLSRTYKTIKYFVEHMVGPNDQVAITSASGQIGFLQQLTNNRAVLLAALDRLKMVPGATLETERPYMSAYSAYLIVEQHDRQLFDYFVRQTMGAQNVDEQLAGNIVERRSRFILQSSDVTIKTALQSLVNLMDVTAKLPGRKLVFFISDGFVPNFVGSDFTTMMSRATRAANHSGVVIYSFDARGLMTDSQFDASNGGGADPTGVYSSRLSGERNFSQEPLNALASDTGGRALLNSNDMQDGVARALDETSRYYLLAWKPANDAQRQSNFSKIKVTIADRPDLKVKLRRGYLSVPRPQQQQAKTEASAVEIDKTDDLGLTESSNEELHAALALGFKQTAGGNMQLNASVQVNAQSAEGGSGNLLVNVLGAVFDSRGKAVGSFKQHLEVSRTPARASPVYSTVNYQLDVPPGLYQVRVFAYERGTTKLTAAMEWVEIPKLKPGTLAISSLYVGEISEGAGLGQVTVNAHRRFARSSRMRFTTYIYNASGTPPQLGLQIKVLRGDQAVITPAEIKVPTEKLTNFANIPYAGEFPLNSLAPGTYTLQLTVTDRNAQASDSQQLRFTIY